MSTIVDIHAGKQTLTRAAVGGAGADLKGTAMTEEEYWAEVRRLGLTPTKVPTVYRDRTGDCRNVPNPTEYSSEDRDKIIRKLKLIMGVSA